MGAGRGGYSDQRRGRPHGITGAAGQRGVSPEVTTPDSGERSEERRVGKECRSLCDWSSDVCSSDLPLLALMRNQILAAEKLGIRAVTIHSENLDEWEQVEAAIQTNAVDVLMVSPERLGNAEFLQKLLPLIQGRDRKSVV